MSSDPSTAAVSGLELSCDDERLHFDFCAKAIRETNHNEDISDERVHAALSNSLCIGAYTRGRQVGLIRFVTDSALFSSLTELFVEEEFRNTGIGSRLLAEAFEHPAIKPTYCILKARSHLWLWYFRHSDFHVIDKRNGIMQRQPR
jgi:GNAT superfamily N-acetyltransferase